MGTAMLPRIGRRRTTPRSSHARLLAQALVSCAGLLIVGFGVRASVWDAPRRSLTDDEKLSLTVSQSDAIVIASVREVRDSTFELRSDPESASSEGVSFVAVTLTPQQWLKGEPEPGDLHVGMFPTMDRVLDDVQRCFREGPVTAVFFLRRSPRGWMVSDDPGGFLTGRLLVLDQPTSGTPELPALRAAVARQSLDSLLTRADLVILGHPGARSSCVRVDSVVLGEPPGATIHVESPVWGVIEPGESVLFLRRLGPGTFETLDFFAGSVPFQSDSLVRQGIPLRRLFERAAELRPGRTAR